MEAEIQKKVIIGTTVGLGSMIIVAFIVVIVLYQLQRCADEEEELHDEISTSPVKGYKIPRPRQGGSSSTSLNTSGVLSDPSPLRSLRFDSLGGFSAIAAQPLNVAQLPLHQGINDPFHVSSQDRRQPLAPRVSGNIALTPFRESSLPGSRIQLKEDGSFVPDFSDSEEEKKKSKQKTSSYGNSLEVNPLYSYNDITGSSRNSTASDIIDMIVDAGIRPPPSGDVGGNKTTFNTKEKSRTDWEHCSHSSSEEDFNKPQQQRPYLDRSSQLPAQHTDLSQEKMKRLLEYQKQQSAASSSARSKVAKNYKKNSNTNVNYPKKNASSQGRVYKRQDSVISSQPTTSSIPGYSVPQSYVTDVYRQRVQNSFQQSMPTNKHFVWTDADNSSSVGTPAYTSSEEDVDTGIDTWGEDRQKSLQEFDYRSRQSISY